MSFYVTTYFGEEDCAGDKFFMDVSTGGKCLQWGDSESTRFELGAGVENGTMPLIQMFYSDRDCREIKLVEEEELQVGEASCVVYSGGVSQQITYAADTSDDAELVQNFVTGATCDEINSGSFEMSSDVQLNDLQAFPVISEQCLDLAGEGNTTYQGNLVGSLKISGDTGEALFYSEMDCKGEMMGSAIDACIESPDEPGSVIYLGGRNLTKFGSLAGTDGALSAGQIGGIVSGFLAVIALAAFASFMVVRRAKAQYEQDAKNSAGKTVETTAPVYGSNAPPGSSGGVPEHYKL